MKKAILILVAFLISTSAYAESKKTSDLDKIKTGAIAEAMNQPTIKKADSNKRKGTLQKILDNVALDLEFTSAYRNRTVKTKK